jgi:hypothetical protein
MKTFVALAAVMIVLSPTMVGAAGPGTGPSGPGGHGMGPVASPGTGGVMGGPWMEFRSEFHPVVGSWAEYRITAEDAEPMTMRIAIVGQEGDQYWYETALTSTEGQRFITKMLVSGNPENRENVMTMIVKSDDEPAMEMPMQMLGMPGAPGVVPEEAGEPEPTPVDLGTESIMVPAGTIEAQHWQYTEDGKTADVWTAPDVGPYSVVKSESKEATMVLTAYGKDAKSEITETPQKITFPGGGMPFQMPGQQ